MSTRWPLPVQPMIPDRQNCIPVQSGPTGAEHRGQSRHSASVGRGNSFGHRSPDCLQAIVVAVPRDLKAADVGPGDKEVILIPKRHIGE